MNGESIIQVIKEALKEQNITYKDLADRLQITEAGIKKQFQSSDISFNRIQVICNLLGLSFSELLDRSQVKAKNNLTFDDEQLSYFLNKPDHLIFYNKLKEARGNFNLANRYFGFDQEHLDKIKADFVDIGLFANGLLKSKANFSKSSQEDKDPLSSKINKIFVTRFAEVHSTHQNNKPSELAIELLMLSPAQVDELKIQLDRVRKIYMRQSELNTKSDNISDCDLYSLCLAFGKFSFVKI